MAEGPFPEHYEPFETPLDKQPDAPEEPEGDQQPGRARVQGRHGSVRHGQGLPVRGHHLPPDRAFPLLDQARKINAIMQPEQFVEIGEELAKEKGIANGDKVKVRSNRGFIKAVAVVTKRIKALDVDGKKVHTVGIPIHWGFKGATKPGFITNTLTPVRRRRQHADAGVQGVPGQHRESVRRADMHCNR
jgi:anaerobic selenocysteine-containing dehydrogenase